MANLVKLDKKIIKDNPDKFGECNFLSQTLGVMTFAYRVKQCLSQSELAEKAGVESRIIHRIEGGSGGIEDNTYMKVFKVLGIGEKEIGEFFLQESKE